MANTMVIFLVLLVNIIPIFAQDPQDEAVKETEGLAVPSLIPFSPSQFSCNENDTSTCDLLPVSLECNTNDGFCSMSCNATDECSTGLGLKCDGGFCVPPDGDCQSDDECPTMLGSECDTVNGACTTDGLDRLPVCKSSADCDGDTVCYETPGVCIPGCNDNSGCDALQLSGATCDTTTKQCKFTCSEDSDCAGDYANQCNTQLNICYYGCIDDDDCGILGTVCVQNPADSTIKQCGPNYEECTQDSDCNDDVTNTCLETPVRNICVFSCDADADCSDIPGTECREETPDSAISGLPVGVPIELPSDVTIKTCQPGAASCNSDADCSDGYKCLTLGGIDLIPGIVKINKCYPSCDEPADCTAAGFKGAECKTQEVSTPDTPFGSVSAGSINYCDITNFNNPTAAPPTTASPTSSPVPAPDVDGVDKQKINISLIIAICLIVIYI